MVNNYPNVFLLQELTANFVSQETKPLDQILEPKQEPKTKKGGIRGRPNRKPSRNSVTTPTTNAFPQHVSTTFTETLPHTRVRSH